MKVFPKFVKIVEVGPRDGLQNESKIVSAKNKIIFIEKLASSGLKEIEVTSFVHPKIIPQLADAKEVISGLKAHKGVIYSALVPNMKGLERAINAGLKRIAVFGAVSETFTKKNINMTVKESLDVFKPVVQAALENGISVRGYVSTCFVCPYEGEIKKEKVLNVTEALLDMGVDEISLGDTIGAASPKDVFSTVGYIIKTIPKKNIALHFHDTYGTALANVVSGLELGITTFDSSCGGLGGCPFAPGASGNLATEDLVYLLERMGIESNVKLKKLAKASIFMEKVLGRTLPSKQLQRIQCKNNS
ncbi:MAG: hydroxymethylglutaryl-CoA lyase [Candidatus Melainabacteria bacterium]|nr:hydroxymethylglutaryl-CoA lyase [Candidatus Melainabacteria bacterium]